MTSVIFGGSSGIGHSIVRDLLKNGHSDIVNIDITPSDIASRNILGDLSCDKFVQSVLLKLNGFDKIDSVIWTVRYRHSDQMNDIDIVKNSFDVELFPLVKLLSDLSSRLITDGTSVVIISSIASKLISSQHFAYNLVKSAQESLVRALAVKYGDNSSVRINAICPGIVDIPGRSSTLNSQYSEAALLRKSSVPRPLTVHVDEISKLCTFLLSQASSALNGATLVADGGESILDQYFVAQRTFNSFS